MSAEHQPISLEEEHMFRVTAQKTPVEKRLLATITAERTRAEKAEASAMEAFRIGVEHQDAAKKAEAERDEALDALRILDEQFEAQSSDVARCDRMAEALRTAVRVAAEAAEEWDKAPSGMRAGKILLALAGRVPGYRQDTDAIHAALADTREASPAPETTSLPPFVFDYRNHRGERAIRRAIFHGIRFGSTEWHPEPQWLLAGIDIEKGARREFALRDVSPILGSASPAWDAGVESVSAKDSALLHEALMLSAEVIDTGEEIGISCQQIPENLTRSDDVLSKPTDPVQVARDALARIRIDRECEPGTWDDMKRRASAQPDRIYAQLCEKEIARAAQDIADVRSAIGARSEAENDALRESLDPDTLEAIADEIGGEFKHSARAGSLRFIARRQRAALIAAEGAQKGEGK